MLSRVSVASLLVLFLTRSMTACLWDRDTPQDEAQGVPDVVTALTGRFERNPPLYYEMRLTRVEKYLQDHPEDLAAYDDAGVACDRLGRGDEAIAWMERKLKQMQTENAANQKHFYRYHANLGTFMVHQWLRQGADRSQIEVVRAAREQIALAIKINPRAHFGREAYQLRAMDWIIFPPDKRTQYHPNLLGWSFNDIYGELTEPSEADEAVRALSGLVILGNAWESVDIFHALNVALQRDSVGYERGRDGGRNTLAYFAWLRCHELIDAGQRSLYPGSPTGEALKSILPAPDFVAAELLLDPAFAELRAEAESWHANRIEFMNLRLKAGRHPDTDSDFWDGYIESPAPQLPSVSVPEAYSAHLVWRRRVKVLVMIFAFSILLVCIIVGLRRVRLLRTRSDIN